MQCRTVSMCILLSVHTVSKRGFLFYILRWPWRSFVANRTPYCGRANHTAVITIHRITNYFSLYFVKYSPQLKMFKMKIIEFNDIHISCHVPISVFLRRAFFSRDLVPSTFGVKFGLQLHPKLFRYFYFHCAVVTVLFCIAPVRLVRRL
jgi:hypothetical protein